MGANEEDWKILTSGDKLSIAYVFVPLTYAIESPQRFVKVRRFALASHEITRGQFAVFAAETKFEGKGCNALRPGGVDRSSEADWSNPWFSQTYNDPVVCVSWNDAQKYIEWLNAKLPSQAAKYRLPTSEEWEYAARAGTTTPTYWNNIAETCRYSNTGDIQFKKVDFTGYNSNGEMVPCDDGYPTTSPVNAFPPNPWGFYDMLGNVNQLTQNCGTQFAIDISFITACTHHILHGTSWSAQPSNIRVAKKGASKASMRTMTNGFRLARDFIG